MLHVEEQPVFWFLSSRTRTTSLSDALLVPLIFENRLNSISYTMNDSAEYREHTESQMVKAPRSKLLNPNLGLQRLLAGTEIDFPRDAAAA